MKRWAVVVLAVVLAACATACGGARSTPKDVLVVGLTAEPTTLDFTRSEGAAIPQVLLGNVYQRLVTLDQDGRVVPDLASSWDVSADRLTWVFHLRPGVRFSNGAAFDADDAAFSLRRLATDWTLRSARTMDVIRAVDVVDPGTVRVTLRRPSNQWLYRLTTRLGAMFSRTGVGDLANRPIGTGPFVLTGRERGVEITLTANPGYWGPPPGVRVVVLRYFREASAMNASLLSGGIDVIGGLQSPESLPLFTGRPGLTVQQGTTNGEVVLSMNNDRPWLRDERFRQAIRRALDRRVVLDVAWAGKGTLIGSMVPPTDPWYEDLTATRPHQPAVANALLDGTGRPSTPLRLRVPDLPYAVNAAQVVRDELAAVGVPVAIEVLEFPARWLDEVYSRGDYDMSIVSHVEPRDISIFADPGYYFHYRDPRFAGLLAEADAGPPQDEVPTMRAAARMLDEDDAADWLFLLPAISVVDDAVTGFPRNLIAEGLDLSRVRKSA